MPPPINRLALCLNPFSLHRPSSHLFPRILATSLLRTYAGTRPLPPRPKIVESDITEAFLKGTGPGGQKINKTSSAVQLKHLPTGIVIKCQETRSRSQNRKIARRILSERIEDLELGEGSRTALKGERVRVKKASKDKKARRKYRKLAEGEEGQEAVEKGVEGAGEESAVGSALPDVGLSQEVSPEAVDNATQPHTAVETPPPQKDQRQEQAS